MVQGSGVSVGPGVRAGGLEDGAQWAPRLLVLYNIISNASFTYSIVWTFAMTCCKERPGRTNTKVFLVLCEVQKILKYRYKGSQHLKKVEFYEKLSQTGGRGGQSISQIQDGGGHHFVKVFMISLYIITTCLAVFVLRCCPVGYVVNVCHWNISTLQFLNHQLLKRMH